MPILADIEGTYLLVPWAFRRQRVPFDLLAGEALAVVTLVPGVQQRPLLLFILTGWHFQGFC